MYTLRVLVVIMVKYVQFRFEMLRISYVRTYIHVISTIGQIYSPVPLRVCVCFNDLLHVVLYGSIVCGIILFSSIMLITWFGTILIPW